MIAQQTRPKGLPLRRKNLAPYIFISPFFITFLLFGLLPVLFSAGVSMFDWRGVRPGDFVGLGNYSILFQDSTFYKALFNTAYLWLGTVPLQILLALVFAVLLNSQFIGLRAIFRTVYFLPVVTSLIITGLVFSMVFSNSFGLVNDLLGRLGFPAVNWLADPNLMKPVLVIAILWRWTGNDMVIMLAGLQSIPIEIYEAARVDGANEFQTFFFITMPLMMPVILFDAIISTIGTFNLFEEPYALFGSFDGGVAQSGLTTGLFMYQNAFVFSKFGYGTAISWVVALIIFGLSMLQLKLGSERSK